MTENKRLIHGSYGEQRYLHSYEIFCKERNWNINLPSEREFKNGYCIITDKDDTAYSIDELVELLNEFQKENEELKSELKIYRKVASCSNCKYQNYDWYDDGDEFEICEKGNNNQQMEYHICKEWEEF